MVRVVYQGSSRLPPILVEGREVECSGRNSVSDHGITVVDMADSYTLNEKASVEEALAYHRGLR